MSPQSIAPCGGKMSLWAVSGCDPSFWDGLALVCRGEETEFFPGFGASDSDEWNPHWAPDFQPLFKWFLFLSLNCNLITFWDRCLSHCLLPPGAGSDVPGLWCLQRHRVTLQTEILRLNPLLSVSGAPEISQTGFWSTAPWITASSMHFNAKLEPQGNRELFPKV